ncbi:hypothetical protein [Burkholderia cenocepacia]|uniref:hypothetical protein n=1 Tax=Burkholderia cenocepacia TaxID=95486 RepID=UPI003847DFAB
MREANFAPVYCSLYPEFAEIARKHGYALAIHGSLAKDMDLVAIPWTDSASEPQAIVDAIVSEFSITQANGWTTREHGRQVTTLVIAFGDCFVDLSFIPRGDSLSRSPAQADARDYAMGHCDGWNECLEAQASQADARVGLTDEQRSILEWCRNYHFRRVQEGDYHHRIAMLINSLLAARPGQPEPRAEVTAPTVTVGRLLAMAPHFEECKTSEPCLSALIHHYYENYFGRAEARVHAGEYIAALYDAARSGGQHADQA